MEPLNNIFEEALGITTPNLTVTYTPITQTKTNTNDNITSLIKNFNTDNITNSKSLILNTITLTPSENKIIKLINNINQKNQTIIPDNTKITKNINIPKITISELLNQQHPIQNIIKTKKMETFPTDTQLLTFLKKQEGTVALQWTDNNNNIITSAGVNGYDLPGGVHNPIIAKEAGISIDTLNPQITNKSRKALQGERKSGATKAYYVNVSNTPEYWNKLLKVYKSYIKKAWNSNKVKNAKTIYEKLALAHIMAWRGNTKNPGPKDIAWKNALNNAVTSLT